MGNDKIVLAIGAHPDDWELGCGGTIKKHINNGATVYALLLTAGQNSSDDADRLKEAEDSANYLGVTDLIHMNYMDGIYPCNSGSISKIGSFIRKINPDIVYTHSEKDSHQDHRNAAFNSRAAARDIANIFLYETPSTTTDFTPHHFSLIGETIDDKLAALELHPSQIGTGAINIPGVKTLAASWGYRLNPKATPGQYAEAFEINHSTC